MTELLTTDRGVTIIGGGIAGLTAAIALAESRTPVRLLEARNTLGGRARTADGPYKASLGPHVLYKGSGFWDWLDHRRLLPDHAGVPMAAVKMRWRGEVRRMPPLRALPAVLRLRGRSAPTDRTFRAWATEHADAEIAEMLSAAAGSYTFHHDPGALSAAFVWERMVRTLLKPPPKTRYIIGGWGRLVESMEAHARLLGVAIETGRRVNELPAPPVILATELYQARMLLGDSSLDWPSGRTVCLDVALRHRRADPFIVSDLDEAGWVERFTEVDPTLAPDGEELVQAHMPIGPDEGEEDAMRRLERLLDVSLVNWRERRTWQRRMVMIGRSGALDAPGTSWRQRPAIRQRDGVFLAGDMTAVPGLLSEVAWASALAAAQGAREALVAGVLAGHP